MDNNTVKESSKSLQEIDIREILKLLLKKKLLMAKVMCATAVISSLLIICVPRYYTCEVMLAPEMSNMPSGGTLSSLASSFGFDIGGALTSDAISPTLYPDLLGSKDFLVSLFTVNVETADGSLKTNYYEYLEKHQKAAWWNVAKGWIMALFKSEDEDGGPTDSKNRKTVNPFNMTKKQNDVADAISGNIKCNVDKKTDVITIVVKDQDKLICATMADSVREKLQYFITDYRTKKARIDQEYYEKLLVDARADYEKARKLYAKVSDANKDVVLESVKTKLDDLENDMQMKFNTYNAMMTQLQAAKAKVQERTPAFTILQGASVPVKPAGPKRMLFVLGMTFLSFIFTAIYLTRDELHLKF